MTKENLQLGGALLKAIESDEGQLKRLIDNITSEKLSHAVGYLDESHEDFGRVVNIMRNYFAMQIDELKAKFDAL